MSKEFFPKRAVQRYLGIDGVSEENYESMMNRLGRPRRLANDRAMAFAMFRNMLALRG